MFAKSIKKYMIAYELLLNMKKKTINKIIITYSVQYFWEIRKLRTKRCSIFNRAKRLPSHKSLSKY